MPWRQRVPLRLAELLPQHRRQRPHPFAIQRHRHPRFTRRIRLRPCSSARPPDESNISGIHYLDRGYEKLVEKLSALGAEISRIKAPESTLKPLVKALAASKSPVSH